ncbi:MAG: tetratricopeptide repeat protein [bacterium ADurb.Bin363]|nr:MAG: tetratricopeptide repeat protein [bacterium ADurb.Bin363]
MVKDFKYLLNKYPVISWIVVGGVALMLIISTLGFGAMGLFPKNGSAPGHDKSHNLDQSKAEIDHWLSEVTKEPSDFNYRQLSRAYMGVNDLEKALETANTAISKDPNDVSSYQLLAEIYSKKTWLEIDDKTLEKVKNKISSDKLEVVKSLKGQKFGVEEFNSKLKAMDFKEEDIQVLQNYSMKNENEKIVEVLQKMVSLAPDNGDYRFALASMLMESGKMKEAIPELQKILKLTPNNEYVRQFLVMAYIEENMYDKAEEELKWMLEQKPDNLNIYSALGQVYIKEKKYNDAISIYEKALTIDSKTGSLYSGLASAYMMKGENEKAIENYRKALNLDPNDTGIHLQIASIYEKMGKKDEAMKELQLMTGNLVIEPNQANTPVEVKEPNQALTPVDVQEPNQNSGKGKDVNQVN